MAVAIKISPNVLKKLKEKHAVEALEVEQCFENKTGMLLKDQREDHKSDPPTFWFIAPTNRNRLLKICFIQRDGDQQVRTAYPPNLDELRIYKTLASPTDF
jgi:hypothetical protein